MKLLLGHLSDIHIKARSGNPVLKRTRSMAAALASTETGIDATLLVISGDLAYSGKPEEYAIVEGFLNSLKAELFQLLPNKPVHVALAPGNHDCDLSEQSNARNIVVQSTTVTDIDQSQIDLCIKPQHAFFECATRIAGKHIKPSLAWMETISIADTEVAINCLNTAWLSQIKERQGTLLFPTEHVPRAPASADLVITTFHHPYGWLAADSSGGFQAAIEQCSDIILTGHEHDLDSYDRRPRTSQSTEYTEYYEGGVLQDSESPNSTFHALVIDLDKRTETRSTFTWSRDLYQRDEEVSSRSLSRTRRRSSERFIHDVEFESTLQALDAEYTHPRKSRVILPDIFVYPELSQRHLSADAARTLTGRDIPAFCSRKKRILISGPDKIGKSSLARTLVTDLLRADLVPLYLTPSNTQSLNAERLPSFAASEAARQYGDAFAERFRQLPPTKRALVFDDFHKLSIPEHARSVLLSNLIEFFDTVVLFADDQLLLSELTSRPRHGSKKAQGDGIWSFKHLEILPFGHELRQRLITKWFSLGSSYEADERASTLRQAMAEKAVTEVVGENLVPSYPVFILTILQQFEAQSRPNPGTAGYGFYYEALINGRLEIDRGEHVDLETKKKYLADFANHLRTSDSKSENEAGLRQFHNTYCSDHDLEIDFDLLFPSLLRAGIFERQHGLIRFKHRYLLHYFLAQSLAERIGDPAVRDHISILAQRVFDEDASGTLLFLSYLSADEHVLSSLLHEARALFAEYEQFDLQLNQLVGNLAEPPIRLRLESGSAREHRSEYAAALDKAERSRKELEQTVDETTDTEARRTLTAINKAIKAMYLLGQIARNRVGSLSGDRKLEITQECYALGLRTLSALLSILGSSADSVRAEIAVFLAEQRPSSSREEIDSETHRIYYWLVFGLAMTFVRHTSNALGLEKLTRTFARVLTTSPNASYKIIDLAIKLDHFSEFPSKEVHELAKLLRNSPFALNLVKQLVWLHFFLFEERFDLRQSICSILKIEPCSGGHRLGRKQLPAKSQNSNHS